MLKLTPYIRDENSYVLYIPDPRTIAVHFQHTEFGKALLDFEFDFAGDTHGQGKFLLRMEGGAEEMRVFSEAILVALRNPRSHPSPADLFEGALIDRSTQLDPLREFYIWARSTKTDEVDEARAKLR